MRRILEVRLNRDLASSRGVALCCWLAIGLVVVSFPLLRGQRPKPNQELGEISGVVVSARTGEVLIGAGLMTALVFYSEKPELNEPTT